MGVSLTQDRLSSLCRAVTVPAYDREALRPGVLHIGLGNFHRSHMAVYLDRLFAQEEALEWGVIGSGVMPADVRMRSRLRKQDHLSTIVEMAPGAMSARVIGVMLDFVPVASAAIVKALADPRIRIVSLTITEGGYFLDAATGRFDPRHPLILADVADPGHPRTLFGMMLKALAERRARGYPPFTVLSCDNLSGNGEVTRRTLIGLAERIDPDLAAWILREVTFPNSMVDCITPRTTARERELVRRRFGIVDAAPVVCEPFRQWVVEDRFCAGRPPLETVGIELVDDISRYEKMKLRILNAGHASIAYVAALLGYRYVHEAMADPDIHAWLLALQEREILPILEEIAGLECRAYRERVFERLRNAEIGDTVARLCANGSTRQPKFILPALRDALAQCRPVDGLALELALWCHYCRVAGEAPKVPALSDPLAARLAAGARRATQAPRAFLAIREVFDDLAEAEPLMVAFAGWLEFIDRRGVRVAVRRYVAPTRHGRSS
ncbi:mannitol dehydrogenase family protein [Halomonas alkalisoli]|uniref:mannitol dehydrogenase family protein n=1 Tax=Halomonas alkalisoli TaxID=2907158 RepID=UPI001F21A25E|nr:mannitol dehydrogenase family protein [Halomonas alkalisoli]MCE9683392.1 mannitol dehydrogenase family protein [Halomonas alkalisoli]